MPSFSDHDKVEALHYINRHVAAIGYPPTHRQIGAIRHRAPSEGHRLLHELEREGLITIAPRIPRGIRITAAGMKAMVIEI